jgi:hypothetical protein|nr:MAG TPA: hypothetical protein [Caudoviricetes sp.]
MIKLKIEQWKTTGKYYSTEEMEVDSLDNIEAKLRREMISTVYIIEEDNFEQPYRAYLL